MTGKEAFFGREREIGELKKIILAPGSFVVTITGIGGIGKTSLALRLLAEIGNDFKNGGILVPLAGLEHTGQLVPAVLSALGREPAGADGGKRLSDTLSRAESLIILDNFEHLVSAAPLIESLSHGLTGSRIVITSRTCLGFPGETVYSLSGIDLPEPGDAMDAPSTMLFLSVYPSGKELNEKDMEMIRGICRAVAGVPLGIKLSASMCGERSLGEIFDIVSIRKNVLDISGNSGERRHRSLRAVFQYSWMLLTPEERQTFAALSVFRGSFSPVAVKAVTDSSGEVLKNLHRKSLLEIKQPGVYELHPLLREFSSKRFTDFFGEGAYLYRRHSEHFTGILGEHGSRLSGIESSASLDMLNSSLPDVLAAVSFAIANSMTTELIASMRALRSVLQRTGLLETGANTFESIAQYLERTHSDAHLEAMVYLGTFRAEMASYDQAVRCFQKGTSSGDPRVRSSACRGLGMVYIRTGNLNRAEEFMTRALDEARASGDSNLQAFALGGIGDLYNHFFDFQKAEYFTLQAVEINRRTGNLSGLFANLITLSNLMFNNGRGEEALGFAEESLEKAELLKGDMYLGLAEVSVAGAMFLLGRYYEALDHAHKGVKLFENIDSRWGMQIAYHALVSVQNKIGPVCESLESAVILDDLCTELGGTYNSMEHLIVVGEVYEKAGKPEEALNAYARSVRIAHHLQIDFYMKKLEEKISKLT